MTLVLTPRDTRRFSASFPYSKGFIDRLRSLPTEDRTWHRSERRWSVDYRHLASVAVAGGRCFTEVDCAALDPDRRRAVHDAWWRRDVAPDSSYAALHLLPSAPLPVVKAAYRALARLHHPDVGGSSPAMVEITRAYEIIVGRR